jgi:hypothetical protein
MSVAAVEDQSPGDGRLFEVPRIAVVLDEADPSVLKLAFSGSLELDRTNAQQVKYYNGLRAGEEAELVVTCHVAGSRKRHRRDSEGYVDAIVETKSLVVSDVFFDGAEEE